MLIQSAAMSKSAHPGRPYPKNNGVHATQSIHLSAIYDGEGTIWTHRN